MVILRGDPTLSSQELGETGLRGAIKREVEIEKRQRECEAKGGTWDSEKNVCILPEPEPKPEPKPEPVTPPRVDPTTPETFTDPNTGRASGITLPDGRTFLGLSPEEVDLIAMQQQQRTARPEGTAPVGTAQALSDAAFRGEQLAGQVGQFQQLGVSPTGVDIGEALTAGVVDSIPSAIKLAGQFGVGAAAIGGAATAPAGGVGAIPAAAVGAAVGFVAGITGGMISNFKSQRRDTTTAQQRVLDEGKQNMKDWATLAKSDPANKAFYLAEYNKQSAQIDQAYRQMKLDVSEDAAKFETALPNLAEFEAFYSAGGERDTLNLEMQNSLLAQSPPNYDMVELAYRRREEQ